MTNYARIEDKIVVEIFTVQEGFTFEESIHPDLAPLFTEVPDNVTVNSTIDSKGKWTIAPTLESAPVKIVYPEVTPMEFQMLFTSSERISIKKLTQTDPVIEDWWSIATNPLLKTVDLNLNSVQETLSYLTQINVLTEERKQEVLSAKVK